MATAGEDLVRRAVRCDFRRPDRISNEQLRSIHVLNENFARNLAASLSAYLRAYAMVTLVSVEQLSFAEFSQCLPSPTTLLSLAMKPYDGNAVLEINPSLAFPILEMLLGGKGKPGTRIEREITEIEENILEGLDRIIVHDLRQAWQGVAQIDFLIEARKREPQLPQAMAPNEAVVAVSLEVRIGENAGMLNLAMPSLILKMLRQRFEQQWAPKRNEPSPDEQARTLRLVKDASVSLEARLTGATVLAQDLMRIDAGDVLVFDYPLEQPVELTVNGKPKFHGAIAANGRKRAFVVGEGG